MLNYMLGKTPAVCLFYPRLLLLAFVQNGLILCLVGSLFSVVYAQDIPPQDSGVELQQQQQKEILERKLIKPLVPWQAEPNKKSEPALDCISIKTITLEDVSLLTVADQNALLQPYLTHCLTKVDIKQLMQHINNAYIAKGYITTRAYLPEQNVSNGHLILRIIEGKIEDIRLNDNKRASDKTRVTYAFPTSVSTYLRLQDIEQGLDQLNRAPSAQAQIALEPGSEIGKTRVLIHTTDEKTWRGRVRVDNDGEKSVGRTRLLLGVDKDNLFEVNDVWTLAAVRTADSRALSLTTLIPYHYWTMLASYSTSSYDVPLTPTISLAGSGQSSLLGVEYLALRNQREQWSWTAQLAVKENERDINSIALTPDKVSTLRVGGRWLYRDQQRQAYVDMSLVKGLRILGALKDPSGLPSAYPHHQFTKLELTGSLRQPLTGQWFWQSQAKAQYSAQGLVGSEQLSMGGSDSVRGFTTATAVGDTGLYWHNQLTRPSGMSWLPNTEYLVFVDGGIVKNLSSPPSHQLMGTGFGLHYRDNRWDASTQLSFPLYKDDALSSTDSALLSLKLSLNY